MPIEVVVGWRRAGSVTGYGNGVDPTLLVSSARGVDLLNSAKSARGEIPVWMAPALGRGARRK